MSGQEPSNPWEKDLEPFGNRLADDIQTLPLPQVPYGRVRLTRDEQMERYLAMENDPQAWAKMIQAQGLEATLSFARTMMRRKHDARTTATTVPTVD